MNEYNFTLKFDIPKGDDLEALSAILYKGGCDDAVIGIGTPGRISLNFTRESNSASNAVQSALKDIKNIAPKAKLTEAAPDLVGATDIAKIMGCKRQNVQKITANNTSNFPSPVYVDSKCENGRALWHLSSVLKWLVENRQFCDDALVDLSSTIMTVNFSNKPANYRADLEGSFRELVA